MTAHGEKASPCKIVFLTEANGAKTMLTRLGELRREENGEISLSYTGETETGALTVKKSRAEWRREGEMRAFLIFDTDEITRGAFGSGGLSGEAQIKTHKIELKTKGDGVSAEIVYTLKFDYGEQKTKVKIRARLFEETKAVKTECGNVWQKT